MFGFFIALFGSIYLYMRYASDKGDSHAAQLNAEATESRMRADYDKWIGKMSDRDLERCITEKIHSKEYLELTDSVLGNIINESKIRGYQIPTGEAYDIIMSSVCPNSRVIIAMASVGKLPYNIASWGISTCARSEFWGIQKLFIDWIDDELQSHGVEPMVFQGFREPRICHSKFSDKILAKNIKLHTGRFGWWSNRVNLF